MSLFGLLPAGAVGAAFRGTPPIGTPPFNPFAKKEHTGLFGIKGTFRDILGVLGQGLTKGQFDYAGLRRKEKMGDAMGGFVDDPLGAIQRVAEIDPEAAFKLQQEHEEQARKAEEHRYKVRDFDDDHYDAQDERDDRTLRMLSGLARAANPNTAPQVYERMRQVAESRGTSLPFDLPSAYDENLPTRFDDLLLEAKDRALVDYRDQRLDQFDRNLTLTEQENRAQALDRGARRAETRRHNIVTEGISGKKADNPRNGSDGRAPSAGAKDKARGGKVSLPASLKDLPKGKRVKSPDGRVLISNGDGTAS